MMAMHDYMEGKRQREAASALPSPISDDAMKATRLEEGAVYRDNTDGGLFVCASDKPDSQQDVPCINFDGSFGFVHYEICVGIEKVANSISEYFALKLTSPVPPSPISDEARKVAIRKAFEADMQQFFTDSLTPDRGYSVSADNLLALFDSAIAKRSELRIHTRCPACQNTTIELNKGHLLCTWHTCPDPTLIDRVYDPKLRAHLVPHSDPSIELATLKAVAEAWSPIHYEIDRRADKMHAEADNTDFEVTINIEDYRRTVEAMKGDK